MATINYLGIELAEVKGFYDAKKNEISKISVIEPVKNKVLIKSDTDYYGVTMSLQTLNVSRRIGTHCRAEAELVLSVEGYDVDKRRPTVNEVVECVEHCKARVYAAEFEVNKDTGETEQTQSIQERLKNLVAVKELFDVADNYYVIDIATECAVKRAEKTLRIVMSMTLASWDYFMDTTPYSKAYVGEKLGAGVMSNMVGAYKSKFGTKWEANSEGIQNVFYEEQKENGKTARTELMQPYLVQFNETEYQFLLRNANRCGEFLFFENGKLIIGLPSMVETEQGETEKGKTEHAPYVRSDLDCYDSMKTKGHTDSFRQETGYFMHNGNNYGDFRSEGKNPDRPYVVEYANDEYFRPIKKDDYDSYYEEMGGKENLSVNELKGHGDYLGEIGMHYLFKVFVMLLEHQDSWGKILTDLWDLIQPLRGELGHGADQTTASDNNKEYTEKYFSDMKDKASQYAEDDNYFSEFAELYTDEVQHDKFGNEDKSYDNQTKSQIKVKARPSTALFYRMRECERESERRQYEVTYDGLVEVALGDLLEMKSISQELFVVVDVQSRSGMNDGVWTNRTVVTLVPEQKDENGETRFYPLPAGVDAIRKSDPQTARVADNSDPLYQGRVRIKYMWQNESEETKGASPWIRVVYPFASTGAGIYSQLAVGDEVMVNYENGNIELPYVTGSVFGIEHKVPLNMRNYSQVFRARNGQMIGITEGIRTTNLMSSLIGVAPYIVMALNALPGVDINTTAEDGSFAKKIMGGVVIRDQYGICQIKTSTDERKVSISSPFGDVVIDAFTGITLTAPNGDINIKGKNVNIIANNNLTLKSGENIEKVLLAAKSSKRYSENTSSTLTTLVSEAAKAVVDSFLDMKLIRNIIETFIRPVDGTLAIKSNRYLLLNSGGGNATIPVSAYSTTKKPENAVNTFMNKVLSYQHYYSFCGDAMTVHYHNMYEVRQAQKKRFLDYAGVRKSNMGTKQQHSEKHKAFVEAYMKDGGKLKADLGKVVDGLIDDYMKGSKSISSDASKYFGWETKDRLEYLKNEYDKFWPMSDGTYCFYEAAGYERPIKTKRSYKDYKNPKSGAEDARKCYEKIAKILIATNPTDDCKLFKFDVQKRMLKPAILNPKPDEKEVAKIMRELVADASQDFDKKLSAKNSDSEWASAVDEFMRNYKDKVNESKKDKDYGYTPLKTNLAESLKDGLTLGFNKTYKSIQAKHSWRKDAMGQILMSEQRGKTKSFNGTELMESENSQEDQLLALLLNPPFTTKNMLNETAMTQQMNEMSNALEALTNDETALKNKIDQLSQEDIKRIVERLDSVDQRLIQPIRDAFRFDR